MGVVVVYKSAISNILRDKPISDWVLVLGFGFDDL